tara:strand:+ start:251 stop:481 length:231 start_codon:yes stop_codon:yes gene_type:complete
MEKFIIVERDVFGELYAWGSEDLELGVELFDSRQEAESEIQDVFEDLTKNQIDSGFEPDNEPSAFVMEMGEYNERT